MQFKSFSYQFWIIVLTLSLNLGALAQAGNLGEFSFVNQCNSELKKGNKQKNNSVVTFERLRKVLPATVWPKIGKDQTSFLQLNLKNLISRELALKMKDGKKIADSGYSEYAKPLEQLQGIAQLIKKNKPMIILGIEIENMKILADFDRQFIEDQYEEFLIDGNDERGIDVGLLVRKDLPLEIDVESHKNLVVTATGELVFSRDLPSYTIREKGFSKPLLTIYGTHFKSQRNSNGDPRSVKKRTQQAKAASLIILDYQRQFPEDRIMISGDFNNDLRFAEDFSDLKKLGLKDAFDISTGETVPFKERGTQFFFNGRGEATISQLDATLFNDVAVKQKIVKSARILNFLDKDGNEYPIPRTYNEREEMPSDHRPTLIIMDLSGES